MASTAAIPMIDEFDDFDWEAAVKEIDEACNKATASNITSASSNHSVAVPLHNSNSNVFGSYPNSKITNKPFSSSRQSTLDRFIGSKPVNQNPRNDARDAVLCEDNDFNDDDADRVKINPETAKTWLYPENVPVRDYQLSITQTALFSNTLVSLPTGLGKTLIAAVVMYNYYNWFPEGKIVFAAPSRPLVMQQIEACHKIVGIPQDDTTDMTGQISPSNRVSLWQTKRVFFVTPQVLEKDIQSGSCVGKQLVCLVIDEAHRASGNYSYCVAVRELMAASVQFRILALTATPGSNHQTIQQVIDNLQISCLEHRSESDPDVTPYVHDRKIELIKVEMGKDAIEVNSLLLRVMRPYVDKLKSYRVFPNRDYQTISPIDYINARDEFRKAPPKDLPQHRCREVEGFYSTLITLSHIRKLLSAHGIHPTFVMLEKQLEQGSFAHFMSRNEDFHKAKVVMQQYLSHGAHSPKFSKMLEVLVEHFRNNDPQKSRVIIFTHYRESVRDIMSSLATIGEYAKAAEFVGQTSGKTLKGQSQKVQQAVLEKFRAGLFNIIVATSIGEEGLDIMEVDLVISFDANISPLRMIQRMGRTGRKSKGRVVVLACEGSELKGYIRKQAISKKLRKFMLNGGMNSFQFHSSPRMVPHVFKPEKVLHKFFIEEYVPRGKKAKDDDAIQTPKYKLKLTALETDLLAKYFDPSSENCWRPSLIAFPHFQEFPSKVHEVSHSMRTTMLIDTMQYLHGLSFSRTFGAQDEKTLEEHCRVETVEYHTSPTREGVRTQKGPETDIYSLIDTSKTEETHNKSVGGSQKPSIHTYLFCSDFTSVDSLGRVVILSVPSFPLNQVSSTNSSSPRNTLLVNSLKSNSDHLNASNGEYPNKTLDDDFETSCLRVSIDLPEDKIGGDDSVFQTEIFNLEALNTELNIHGSPSVEVENTHSGNDLSTDAIAGDLSPRLTNLLMSGVVPESPIDNGTLMEVKGCLCPDVDMIPNSSISLVPTKSDAGVKESTPDRVNVATSCKQAEIRTPRIDLPNGSSAKCVLASNVPGEFQAPLTKLSNGSCSQDWLLSSGEKSFSQPKPRLKRLRKYGDIKSDNFLDKKKTADISSSSGASCAKLDHPYNMFGRGDPKLSKTARVFIDDEAEVSSDASGDEEADENENSYGGSFIDDRINLTVRSTQGEASPCDPMAFYRRSLLTQSPIVDYSSGNSISIDRKHDDESAAATTNPYLHTNGESSSINLNAKRLSSDSVIPGSTNEVKKRKLSFSDGESLPIRNLEKEICLDPEALGNIASSEVDEFDNDDFYQGIDLDALEEQAIKQLRLKSELSNKKSNNHNLEFFDAPSFDLGIE
uniref:DEAD-box ATP-dependent RNA helicase FANCM n=1 Tax=Erigeron canadensis TaxID=72917 RepID=UPI001CB9921F|nr:DEAD-box ATP-dependent RNA helicase FANCM [Erigeron canadensis]